MNIKKYLTAKRRESLASFFTNVAVGWFVAAFITPGLLRSFSLLTILAYIVMMILSLSVAMVVLPKE